MQGERAISADLRGIAVCTIAALTCAELEDLADYLVCGVRLVGAFDVTGGLLDNLWAHLGV